NRLALRKFVQRQPVDNDKAAAFLQIVEHASERFAPRGSLIAREPDVGDWLVGRRRCHDGSQVGEQLVGERKIPSSRLIDRGGRPSPRIGRSLYDHNQFSSPRVLNITRSGPTNNCERVVPRAPTAYRS